MSEQADPMVAELLECLREAVNFVYGVYGPNDLLAQDVTKSWRRVLSAYERKLQAQKDEPPAMSLYQAAWCEVLEQRDEIVRAFGAKYSLEPDEIEQVEQRLAYETVWFVRRRHHPPPPS